MSEEGRMNKIVRSTSSGSRESHSMILEPCKQALVISDMEFWDRTIAYVGIFLFTSSLTTALPIYPVAPATTTGPLRREVPILVTESSTRNRKSARDRTEYSMEPGRRLRHLAGSWTTGRQDLPPGGLHALNCTTYRELKYKFIFKIISIYILFIEMIMENNCNASTEHRTTVYSLRTTKRILEFVAFTYP